MEGYQQGGGGENGGKVLGIRSIISRHKIDRGRISTEQEMEKRKNF